MKKVRNLVIALAVLIVLGVVYFLAKQGLFEEKEEAEETVSVTDMSADDIQEISFKLGEDTVKFTKTEDTWKLESDANFPVDDEKLGTVLDAVADLEAIRELTDAEDASEYGLDNPINTITVKDTDGEEFSLNIGDSASTGDIYVNSTAKEGTVYTVSSSFSSQFDKKVYDFAQSTDFPDILTDNIEKVTVENAGDTYVLYQEERTVEETAEEDTADADAESDNQEDTEDSDTADTEMVWMIQKNSDTPADADSTKVGEMKSQIAGLTYVDYVNYDCADMSQYGLAEPSAKITVIYKDTEGEEQTAVLYLGDTDENGNSYSYVEGTTEVHTIASEVATKFHEMTVDNYKAVEETEESSTETE